MTGSMTGIDFGSAWTVVTDAERGLLLDEPTLVARGRGGGVLATGRRALALSNRPMVEVRPPIRAGLVDDPTGCVHLLEDLLTRAGTARGVPVRLAVPTDASAYDVALLAGVVYSVTGARPVTVPSLLAGANGAGVGADGPEMVCDVGAGLIEFGVVDDGVLVAATSAPVGLVEFERDRTRALHDWISVPDRVLDAVPAGTRSALAGRPVRLIGGGALVAGVGEQLSWIWRRRVDRLKRVRYSVATGLLSMFAAPLPV